MAVSVDVELESAVVSYRLAAGKERSSSARKVSSEAVLGGAPWRTFRPAWKCGDRRGRLGVLLLNYERADRRLFEVPDV